MSPYEDKLRFVYMVVGLLIESVIGLVFVSGCLPIVIIVLPTVWSCYPNNITFFSTHFKPLHSLFLKCVVLRHWIKAEKGSWCKALLSTLCALCLVLLFNAVENGCLKCQAVHHHQMNKWRCLFWYFAEIDVQLYYWNDNWSLPNVNGALRIGKTQLFFSVA